jgi:hypothetical protein
VPCRGDGEESGLVAFAGERGVLISGLLSYRGEGAGRQGSRKGPLGG